VFHDSSGCKANRRDYVGTIADADKNRHHLVAPESVGIERHDAHHSFDLV
jgi:hypothetical protein